LYALLSLNLSLSNGLDNSNACCTTINQATLMTANNMGGYCLGPFYLSSLTPNTANAHTNRLSYSLRVMDWFNNATQNSKHAFWIRDNFLGSMGLGRSARCCPSSSSTPSSIASSISLIVSLSVSSSSSSSSSLTSSTSSPSTSCSACLINASHASCC
jgi:hypothetical protein